MKNDRQCPFCLAGDMRTIRSRQIGRETQQQRWECKSCKRRITVNFDRAARTTFYFRKCSA